MSTVRLSRSIAHRNLLEARATEMAAFREYQKVVMLAILGAIQKEGCIGDERAALALGLIDAALSTDHDALVRACERSGVDFRLVGLQVNNRGASEQCCANGTCSVHLPSTRNWP